MNRAKLNRRRQVVANKLCVGVDLAKSTHVASVMLPDGTILGKPLRVSHDRGGFEKLWDHACKLTGRYSLAGFVVGMEPTGGYWEPLARFLAEKTADQERTVEAVLVSGRVVKSLRSHPDGSGTKDDNKDSFLIADGVHQGYYSPIRLQEGVWARLRAWSISREALMGDLTVARNRLTSIIDKHWPERERVIKDCLGRASLALLDACPFPEDVLRLGVEGICRVVKLHSNGGRLGLRKAEALVQGAATSVGVTEGVGSARLELCRYREEVLRIQTHLHQAECHLLKAYHETGLYHVLSTIRGVSDISIAAILGQIGRLDDFSTVKEVTKLAGLNLVENLSGKKQFGNKKISKIGRAGLRTLLYRASIAGVRHNAVLRVSYLRLVVKGTVRMKAVVATMSRLLRLIFAMSRSGQTFSEEKVDRDELARLETEALKLQRKRGQR